MVDTISSSIKHKNFDNRIIMILIEVYMFNKRAKRVRIVFTQKKLFL